MNVIGGMAAIRQHLFVLAPNNSGSTFLTRALAMSPGAWALPREGQHVSGFSGPSSRGTGTGLLWAQSPETIAMFTDPTAYDWERSRKAWHFRAEAAQAEAAVLVVSSPPFLLIARELLRHFPDASFVLMVRNPYAMVESILRGSPGATTEAAARHVVATLSHQRSNRDLLGKRATLFSYEEMCHDPGGVARRIEQLVPALGPVELDRRLAVKGNYDEELRDMNPQQLARLAPSTIEAANAVFDRDRALLDHFGYPRLGS